MLYIKEIFPNEYSVEILVDGILDEETVPLLKKVCECHLQGEKRVLLRLEGLLNASRDGRDFLYEIQNRAILLNAPQFMTLKGKNEEKFREKVTREKK